MNVIRRWPFRLVFLLIGMLAGEDGPGGLVFDNIPLTKLALEQGGYDWGALAYAVGFGGSMV